MNIIFRIIFSISVLSSLVFSNSLVSKNLYDKNITLNKGSFKVLEFGKMIKSIKVSDSESIEIDFVDDEIKPLQAIKISSKKIGHGNILISFYDSTSIHIDVNISENLKDIISIAKEISPKLIIKQTNGKIILKGTIKNQKAKDKILDLFEKAGVELEKDLVDLAILGNPDKMIRVKLYAVEINNDKGLDLKNNWLVSSKNYIQTINKDKLYENQPLDPSTDQRWNDANNQRIVGVHDAIDSVMTNAVSLTGGLTGAANFLGKLFNVGFTLNYLSSKGVANILDETTLLTLENKEATFHAGGTIYTKVQTTTAEGVPSTNIRDINYGLQLNIKAENIVNEEFINLDITTKSTGIDWANQVDGIPSFTEKSIKTNVIVGNKSTIVLGGLINRNNSKDIDKIPLLGDIPILGFLFTSKAFKEGKSELVFFITPEIVDPKINTQEFLLKNKTNFVKEVDKKFDSQKQEEKKEKKVSSEVEKVKKEVKTSQEKTHEERMKEMLGN
jgi:pilus assembly protein CpaC